MTPNIDTDTWRISYALLTLVETTPNLDIRYPEYYRVDDVRPLSFLHGYPKDASLSATLM